MGGLLTHLIAGFASLVIVQLVHFKWEFSWAILVGNLLPDAIKFGFTAIKQLTLSIFYVQHDGFYQGLAAVTTNPTNWVMLGVFVFALGALLYHFHVIKKRSMREYDELYLFLLIGILTHLVLDVFIIEQGPWI